MEKGWTGRSSLPMRRPAEGALLIQDHVRASDEAIAVAVTQVVDLVVRAAVIDRWAGLHETERAASRDLEAGKGDSPPEPGFAGGLEGRAHRITPGQRAGG